MTNRFTTLAAAIAIFLSFSALAAAGQSMPLGTAGGWAISTDGKACAGSMMYENNTALSFVIGADGRAAIAVHNERWNIPKGDYRVWVGVDRAAPDEFEGRADGEMVFMPWQLRSDQIALVSRGAVIRFLVGQQSLSYRLDGSAAMLTALGRCAAERLRAANPFAGVPPVSEAPPVTDPFAETASNPYRRM